MILVITNSNDNDKENKSSEEVISIDLIIIALNSLAVIFILLCIYICGYICLIGYKIISDCWPILILILLLGILVTFLAGEPII